MDGVARNGARRPRHVIPKLRVYAVSSGRMRSKRSRFATVRAFALAQPANGLSPRLAGQNCLSDKPFRRIASPSAGIKVEPFGRPAADLDTRRGLNRSNNCASSSHSKRHGTEITTMLIRSI